MRDNAGSVSTIMIGLLKEFSIAQAGIVLTFVNDGGLLVLGLVRCLEIQVLSAYVSLRVPELNTDENAALLEVGGFAISVVSSLV